MATQYSVALLKILVIVFAMNATLSYGACCIEMDLASNEEKMPCHSADNDEREDKSKCCSVCVVMVLPLEQVKPIVESLSSKVSAEQVLFISNNVDPPFRPPINHLS